MVDTIRTLGELNALFADNATGDVSEQDIRDLVVSQNVHAEMGRNSLSTSIGTTYTKVPMTKAGVFERGFTTDLPNDQISGTPVNLKASISVEAQIDSLQQNRTLDLAVFISGVEAPTLTRSFPENAMPGHYYWSIGVQLSQNDTIDIRAKADQAGVSVDVAFIVLRVQRIGVE